MIEELSRISYLERRFLASLLLTLVMSYAMRNRTRTHNLLSAILVLYVAFDYKHTIYVVASVMFNVVLLRYCNISEYVFTFLNMLILYLYKIFGTRFEERISGSFDISGVLMMMTIKTCYLGKQYNKQRDNIKEAISYLLFIPGLILGPVPTFESFRNNAHRKPRTIPYGTFLRSIGFLFLFQLLRTLFPRDLLFRENRPLLNRIIHLYIFTVTNRIKFYFAWHFSHGCFIFQNFPDLLNADFLKVELATNVKDLTSYWNVCTGIWLKNCFFVPMKDRSIFLASVATSAISALWHGINPCYLIMFLSISTSIPVVRENNRLLLHFYPSLFWLVSRLQMFVLVMYFSSSFFLLNVADLISVWKSVYFIGHVFFFLSLALQLVLRYVFKINPKKKVE